jgi:tetratricopeptide (TPR) repeat protein
MALQHHQAGQLAEAERIYRQVLAAQPAQKDALHLLGVLALQSGKPAIAVDLISRAIAIDPNFADFHWNLGRALLACGRAGDAIASHRRAIALRADRAEFHNDLAIALHQTGQRDAAIAEYRAAIAIKADLPDPHNNLGRALFETGQFDAAIDALRSAISLRPQYPEAHNNLAHALRACGRYPDAIAEYQTAISQRPGVAEAHCNLGGSLLRLGQVEPAIESLQTAISLNADLPEAHNNLGICLMEQLKLDQAEASFRRAIQLRSDFADAHNDLAMVLLLRGDFARGWEEYEWRWKLPEIRRLDPKVPGPPWDGSPLDGKSIYLHAEQGFGDTIQFARYIPIVAQRGGRVTLACQPEVAALIHEIEGIERIILPGEPRPACDTHLPLLSLPRAFGTRLDTIPAAVPYIRANPDRAQQWKSRLAEHDGLFKVGLCWSGRPTHSRDIFRSIPPQDLAPLERVNGVRFFNLQKGATTAPPIPLVDHTSDLRDFSDTAALIENLDLVVTVDTAAAHVAGAMGKPVWILLSFCPDWRWLLDRADSPWYPTARLFRQPTAGDWSSPIREMLGAMQKLLREPM